MLGLVGALSALDPDVRDSVKIIGYFDALLSEKVGVDGVLRGAHLLGQCPIGMAHRSRSHVRRVDSTGVVRPAEADADGGWPSVEAADGDVVVWLERQDPPHLNDDMLLERLALVMAITVERTTEQHKTRPAFETLMDAASSREERNIAAGVLGIAVNSAARVVASPAASSSANMSASLVVPTEIGLLRAMLDRGQRYSGRVGIGMPTSPLDLHSSWRSAVTALKFTTPAKPVVDAASLGVLLQLAELDPGDADVRGLESLTTRSPWAVDTLAAFAETGSVRAAAQLLRRHHSTVEARLDTLSAGLGYDVRSPTGKTRMSVTIALWRLHTVSF